VPARDVAAMTRCALELLREPERARQMGQRARVSARARFCSTLVIPRYEAFYEKLLGGSR